MQMTRRDFLRSAAMSAALAAVAGPAGVARAAEANTPEKWVKGVSRARSSSRCSIRPTA